MKHIVIRIHCIGLCQSGNKCNEDVMASNDHYIFIIFFIIINITILMTTFPSLSLHFQYIIFIHYHYNDHSNDNTTLVIGTLSNCSKGLPERIHFSIL